jgi:hypothetical protein
MTPQEVTLQLNDVFSRMIQSGLSVQQNFPSTATLPASDRNPNGKLTIGNLPSTSYALRDVEYNLIYSDIEKNNLFHIKTPDGGLITYQYTFDNNNVLRKHRLAFFPSISLPTSEEAPQLYENDELYGDIISNRLVRFPIRFDFDPDNHNEVFHPQSHLTLGQFEHCRIPVTGPVTPYSFTLFLVRNFYFKSYKRYKNIFDKKTTYCQTSDTLTEMERKISHVLIR